MGSVAAGIILVVIGILLWVGVITLSHAFAIFLVIIGLGLALFYYAPAAYVRRVR